jgi:TPR repeat protein
MLKLSFKFSPQDRTASDGKNWPGGQGRGRQPQGSAAAKQKGEANMADIGMMKITAVETDAEGCFALGMNYSAGAGVAVDLVQAHKWFNIAAMRGHRDAARLRREIAEQMIDSEIGCAQRAARDWLKSHPQASAPIESMRVAA